MFKMYVIKGSSVNYILHEVPFAISSVFKLGPKLQTTRLMDNEMEGGQQAGKHAGLCLF